MMFTRRIIHLVFSPLLLIFLLLMLSAFRTSFNFNDVQVIDVHISNRLIYELVPVEGGTFTMGATREQGRYTDDDEKPAHSITLGNFWIGKFEITQGIWFDVMGENPSFYQDDETAFSNRWRDLPVENVSWDDCQEFIRRINARRNEMNLGDYSYWKFRLPTEAEWEYAARGGKKRRGYMYSGSNNIGVVAWYENNSAVNGTCQTHPVGMKKANELGIYDMSGNVWEWCLDWYDSDYYNYSPKNNPYNNDPGSDHIDRGGGYEAEPKNCRVAWRDSDTPDKLYSDLGLRLVLAP